MHRILAALLLLPSLALADTSPLQFQSVAISADGGASLATMPMPKGWFSSRNTLDKNKSDLKTVITFAATSCSPAALGPTLSSKTQGNFTALYNPPETNAVAYTWNTTVDLSSYQNHWHNHFTCALGWIIDGCNQDTSTSFTITAYDQTDVQCHTYVNDGGQTVCASDTKVATLSTVQDPDVIDSCSGGGTSDPCDVGIGQCVSACENTCNGGDLKGKDKANCNDACECTCKLQLLPSTCSAYQKCL